MKNFYKKGFTLVELLVVIAIIGILASIITVSLGTARAKGRDSKRISDIRSIQVALEEYYNDNNSFPTGIYSNQLANYLAVVPCDPNSGGTCIQYTYDTWNSGNTFICLSSPNLPVGYHLGAVLEDATNGSLNQDVDKNTNLQICGSSGQKDFFGKSTNCGSSLGATDSCYDVVNN